MKKGREFVFYAPHNYTLKNPGLYSIMQGKCAVSDRISLDKCLDYHLSKYQGSKHGGNNESYRAIEKLDDATQELEDVLKIMEMERGQNYYITNK